jgi:hypothetical protein
VIWVLLAILIFGGGESSLLEAQLKQDEKHAAEVLQGSEHRAAALELIESMRKISGESFKLSQKQTSQALKQARAHERPSAEIGATLASSATQLAALDRTLLDKREALRGLLTREEWNAIFQADTTETGRH